MATIHHRQGLDMEEPPLDPNLNVLTHLPIADLSLYSQLAPNSIPRSFIDSPPGLTGSNLLSNSKVPPRPKPPVPSEYFVYPTRNWRSMTKQQVQMHILDRYAARERYMIAYKDWEEKHSKWVFGVYTLLRTVTKSQRQEVELTVGVPPKNISADTSSTREQPTITDVIADLDVDFGTALTALQEGAEADELDRVKRLWTKIAEQNHRNRPGRNACVSTPVLCMPDRQGKGAFGSRGSGPMHRQGTPNVELPDQATQKIYSSMSSCVPPKLLPDQEESSASESEDEDEDEDEEKEKETVPSWRIYSDECSCGYAGCHCRSWMRWWNKTFRMLEYADHIKLQIRVPSVPRDGLPSGPGIEHFRDVELRVGERHELLDSEPPIRSLHEFKSPKSKKRPQDLVALDSHPEPIAVKTQNGGADALDARVPPKRILENRWEYGLDANPQIPEYALTIHQNIWRRESAVPTYQWASRNRALQWISYFQYTYSLPPEIFFLAVNLLDRYAAVVCQPPAYMNGVRWELTGFVCLWLAWKYENHTSVPRLEDVIEHAGIPGLTRNAVLALESSVRTTVGFNLFYVGPLYTTRIMLDSPRTPPKRETMYLARFLAEVSTTVPRLVCLRPSNIGHAAASLACMLTDTMAPNPIQQWADSQGSLQVTTHLILGVLRMPRPIEKPREQALFYKWTLPTVNNMAGWCQGAFRSVWPDNTEDNTLPYVSERLAQLRAVARAQPFQLGPGPSPRHALYEA
ncbi:G2/mitotic-specific cyclin-B [Aspergillus nidulans FGSC A4] [Rhizoctonia solani]|uniref:G2/mitotic-specific cyclin-B [Aspergillus nidulans FGSC A4] n=1 Tax=Rhizoctonia solani TaxID=456999 RepID=A0A0K6FYH5_9AGAM|nr:G2/mitotic-specific cyclin-B [Aspergillus nidulans FGSC A4] [Rhizoctonia solani]